MSCRHISSRVRLLVRRPCDDMALSWLALTLSAIIIIRLSMTMTMIMMMVMVLLVITIVVIMTVMNDDNNFE